MVLSYFAKFVKLKALLALVKLKVRRMEREIFSSLSPYTERKFKWEFKKYPNNLELDNLMKQNKSKMNSSMTKFTLFGSRQELDKFSFHDIDICGALIKEVSYIRF